jgi:hypothetical protein
MSDAESQTSVIDEYNSLEEYADRNLDTLVRVLRHSGNNYARGCALAAICETRNSEDIEKVIDELKKETER